MSTDDYLDAISEYNERCADLDKLQKFVKDAAFGLEFRRERISFQSLDERLGSSASVVRRADAPFVIKPEDWPTVDALQDAVKRWGEAKKKAQTAWNKVPPHRQQALPRPPT